MDRGSLHDSTVVIHSSIALLQERFRELQRVKAMRAEREVMRVIPFSVPINHGHFTTMSMDSNMHYQKEPASLYLDRQPDRGFGSPLSQISLSLSLSLWPTLQTKYEEEVKEDEGTETQPLINLWPTVTSSPSSNNTSTSSDSFQDMDTDCDESDDVDTSLHL